jgi:hypothetical protein
MLAFDSLPGRYKKWAAFRSSDDWKTYSAQPRHAYRADCLQYHERDPDNFLLADL